MNVSSKSSVIMCVCCRYVVDRRWFDQWKEFVETGDQNSTSFPGQIDNAELFEGQLRFVCFSETQNDLFSSAKCRVLLSDLDSYHLKDRLVEDEDFVLVPAEAWHKLLSWYGMADDQPPLERKVTSPRAARCPESRMRADSFCWRGFETHKNEKPPLM